MSEDIQETPSSTPNFKTELAQQLAAIAPETIADGKVDVQKLKELLNGDAADESERFGLFWPGKLRAIRAAQEPTTATLKPEPELSKDWDTTNNVFIEGDNLEALKILQKHYHGQIKMIYIDPPYNTGKDFVYPDNYKEGLKTYLEYANRLNEFGEPKSSNDKNAIERPHYHSNWLNMLYPRLKLARTLLTEDGSIFISIDDHESARLRAISDEIFGEMNFRADISWQKRYTRSNNTVDFTTVVEHILVYSKTNDFAVNLLPRDASTDSGYSNPDDDPRGPWITSSYVNPASRQQRPNLVYTITGPDGRKIDHPTNAWKFSQKVYETDKKQNRLWWGKDGSAIYPRRKVYLAESRGLTPTNFWSHDYAGNTDQGGKELSKLLGGKYFDFPKPVSLIKRVLEHGSSDESIILDFFSGSSTTAHAVMQLNAEDGGSRRHIQVQLPEPVDPDSPAGRAGFKTIADISRKRIDLAGEKIKRDYAEQLKNREQRLDVGYRAYSLTDTNFAKWHESSATDENTLARHLFDLSESADDDASELALLTEVLLKQGYSLTESVRKESVSGLNVWSVADGLVLAYMDEHVKPTLDQLRVLVDREPERLIVLEDAFQGDDELKTNLVQAAKTRHVELWTA
ncbi:MAG: site-specific DNA-methyltransferase [Bifidobacterium sp.]|uniref:site-specific DNA-methyltransferase n=1 Tax=Bifidobacterium sp. TaxID=41200 RepID=UPI0039E90366